jgi:hypothetical protein
MLHFRLNEFDEAESLCKSFHYSGSFPAIPVLCGTWHVDGGLWGDAGEAVAACVFALPPCRWSEPILELQRLVRKENVAESLTRLISLTVNAVHKRRSYDLLVSYADPGHLHHGGIYQAASWFYSGCREPRMEGVMMNGTFIPGRTANSLWGTSSPQRLRVRFGFDALPKMDHGKHLYWRPLSRFGIQKAERFGLKRLPYPKPKRTTGVLEFA